MFNQSRKWRVEKTERNEYHTYHERKRKTTYNYVITRCNLIEQRVYDTICEDKCYNKSISVIFFYLT